MKVAVIGSGGREHAISWVLSKSPKISQILCIPGNGGTANEEKCKNIELCSCEKQNSTEATLNEKIAQICAEEKVDFVVCGPEEPLANGIADKIWDLGIPVVGPKTTGAQLEASKDRAKTFMQKYGVSCAKSKTFSDAKSAMSYIREQGAPIVVKADGLAAGKGVVVAQTVEQAYKAVSDFMENKTLGSAGNSLVIEEYLTGIEISILAAVSVTPKICESKKQAIVPFVTARDHKRLMDGAKGPNTGGMGAIAPVADVKAEQMELFNKTILEPTLNGMVAEKMDYRGFIFFGIMLTKNGPKLLEYNVRLGDPETQAVLPLVDFDFADLCTSIIDGTLKDFKIEWKKGFCCAPVAVSGGYPNAYKKGYEIHVDKSKIEQTGAKIFIAGGKLDNQPDKNNEANNNKILVTDGGRVLACSCLGKTFEQAWEKSYEALKAVDFKDIFYRKDIGLPGAAESN
ncbi:MAG: phosphoribosylamine--glycine ligase [Treponemataceae bacterium]